MACSDDEKMLAENEIHLKAFYGSGEPETTERYKFIDVHSRVTISESEKAGYGCFLTDPAIPGQLLIVENAIASCTCIRECTPYKHDSYVHAPKAAWKPARPRIPLQVHDHLTKQLIQFRIAKQDHALGLIFGLDAHDPNGSTNGFSSPGFRSSSRSNKPDDTLQLMKNMVANNAMCTKVRSLSLDEPRQVETCDWWGVWVLPSYINHSCTPNCHRMRVGQAMFIRAAAGIAAGDELTLPYFDIFEPLTIRDANCQTFGFRCECPRCTFERSLGKRYNDIQMQIVKLKIQLQTEWTVNATTSGRQASMLLQYLADLVLEIHKFLPELIDYMPHTKSTQPASTFPRKLQYKMRSIMHEYWIHASFIDAHVAMFALCATRPSIIPLGCDPLLEFEKNQLPIGQTEEGQTAQRTFYAATQILDIIKEVHPGNMLGQEFFSIAVKAFFEFAECENSEVVDRIKSELGINFLQQGLTFHSYYYGK